MKFLKVQAVFLAVFGHGVCGGLLVNRAYSQGASQMALTL
jgi:hypothetical protein